MLVEETEKSFKSITDASNIEKLQAVIEKCTGIFPVLLGTDGKPILGKRNNILFENISRLSGLNRNDFLDIIANISNASAATRMPSGTSTSQNGFLLSAVPIFYKGKHFACILFSQIQTTEISSDPMNFLQPFNRNIQVITESVFRNMYVFFHSVLNILFDKIKRIQIDEQTNQLNEHTDIDDLCESFEALIEDCKDFFEPSGAAVYIMDYYSNKLIVANKSLQEISGFENTKNKTSYSDIQKLCPIEKLIDKKGVCADVCKWNFYNNNATLFLESKAIKWLDGRLAVINTIKIGCGLNKRFLAMCLPTENDLWRSLLLQIGNGYLVCYKINGMKQINYVYGREIGDELINSILEWTMSIDDTRSKYYFVTKKIFVIMMQDRTQTEVLEFTDKLYKRFELPWNITDENKTNKIYAGAAIGVMPVEISAALENQSMMVNVLERLILQSKQQNKPIIFNSHEDKVWQDLAELQVNLKNTVSNNMEGFYLNYQPIVDFKTQKIVGLEVLARWNSPNGICPPDEFIREAEKINIITMLNDWVFETALSQAKIWQLDNKENFVLSVNLSPIQLREPGLVDKLQSMLEKHDYPADKFALEVTETEEFIFTNETINMFNSLKKLGIKLFLDDFGVGYGSFSRLMNIPFDTLKIDRSFMLDFDNNTARHTVEVIAEYAKTLGLDVLIEGVENAQQLEGLAGMNIDMIQGYYFSKPLGSIEMQKLINDPDF